MSILQIKTDPKRPYHYIIGIRMNHNILSDDAGKMSLGYNPVFFTNEDIENYKQAIMLSQDPILITDIQEALRTFNCSHIYHILHGMKISAHANQASLHHFSMEEELLDANEWFKMFIDTSNFLDSNKKILRESKI